MSGTELTGLDGTNPLAFLAAVGVQTAFHTDGRVPRLWWTDTITPHAVVDADCSVDRISARVLKAASDLEKSVAIRPRVAASDIKNYNNDVKFRSDDIRSYLMMPDGRSLDAMLSRALVAEGSLDNNGRAKPSDLHFLAGQQLLLESIRDIWAGVTEHDLAEGLLGPWTYGNGALPTLGWDVADDRDHALRAGDPSGEAKLTNPGVEAMAILGLARHPVFGSPERTLTSGCSGGWKKGAYTWPLWNRPAGPGAVGSLLAQARYSPGGRGGRGKLARSRRDRSASDWGRNGVFESWSLIRILKSDIRRSDQGGYGLFRPAEVIWSRHWNR